VESRVSVTQRSRQARRGLFPLRESRVARGKKPIVWATALGRIGPRGLALGTKLHAASEIRRLLYRKEPPRPRKSTCKEPKRLSSEPSSPTAKG
jgi:hypothetical protein